MTFSLSLSFSLYRKKRERENGDEKVLFKRHNAFFPSFIFISDLTNEKRLFLLCENDRDNTIESAHLILCRVYLCVRVSTCVYVCVVMEAKETRGRWRGDGTIDD